MNTLIKIDCFIGEWAFLSNFDTCPLVYRNILFNSSEHAYQADKFIDESQRLIFAKPHLTAYAAKKLGRTMKPVRPDWDTDKIRVMREILIVKFTPGEMRMKLASTGQAELIEGNWWHDRFWGVCYGGLPDGFHGRKCRSWPHESMGENWLGKLIMEVRTLLDAMNGIVEL